MRKTLTTISLAAVAALSLSACASTADLDELRNEINRLESDIRSLNNEIDDMEDCLDDIVDLINDQRMNRWNSYSSCSGFGW